MLTKVFLAGGIFFFLFSGFRRQRFESFSGLRFACFGHESCCSLRLPDAVFQGQVFLAGGIFFFLFIVGSVGNVSRVFRPCVSRALGTNPAAV